MTTHISCDYASEEFSVGGPTGRFREVIEAVATDHGGNVLAGPGPVAKVAKAAKKFRIPVRLTPTALGDLVDYADVLTDPHMAR